MNFETVIKGGTVVTDTETFKADIGIAAGRIAAIGGNLSGADNIDATGRLVMPGGIDSHVHLAQPAAPGIVMGDDFESGTRSAVWGGNTTVMPFCLQQRGDSLRASLAAYHREAAGKCYCDVSFHLIVTDPTPQVLGQELPALLADGYTSLKVFMTYEDMALTDRQILEVMTIAREHQGMVMVHAENIDIIRFKNEQLAREGKTSPVYHGASRPIPVEREATHRATTLAEIAGVPVMIVHISNGQALEEVERARARGVTVFGETCPQYLLLTEADMGGEGLDGGKYVCSPPPRDRQSQEACWRGLSEGVFDVFSSDHCPYRFDETGKLNSDAARGGYQWIPNGIPGIETRLPILFSEGVGKGRISLNRFVALTSTNAARLYGLHPQKGAIAEGADADIAIWDPELRMPITQAGLHHATDYTPFEGVDVTGWPITTLVRGRVVIRDRRMVGDKAWGIHHARGPAGRPAATASPA
jgi:dihydropyrimidinase